MRSETVTHIWLDEDGAAWIDDTNVNVVQIVRESQADPSTPQELAAKHPQLTLAQIHAALAYYHDHKSDVDRQANSAITTAARPRRALIPVRQAIENSRSLLALKPDWDEAGSPPVSENAWQRATSFLLRYAESILERHAQSFEPPDILPGPHGSIDLHWDRPGFEMLINIPADDRQPASFYGDDRDRISIKGRFEPDRVNDGLLNWLTRVC